MIDGNDGDELGRAMLPIIHACTSDLNPTQKFAWWSAFMGCIAGMAPADLGHDAFLVLLLAVTEAVDEHRRELKAGSH
jgi:hypothetical protein